MHTLRPLSALLCLLAGPLAAQAPDPLTVAASDFESACLYTNASNARAAAVLVQAGYAPSSNGIFTRGDGTVTAMIMQSPDGHTRGCGIGVQNGDPVAMAALVEHFVRAAWGPSAEESATKTGGVVWTVRNGGGASTMALVSSGTGTPVMTLMTFNPRGFSK